MSRAYRAHVPPVEMGVNPELEGLTESYELAFRMEGAVPEVMDLTAEIKARLEAYGINDHNPESFGLQHLLELDHEKLTFTYSGRDYRLTDLVGVVAKDVVA